MVKSSSAEVPDSAVPLVGQNQAGKGEVEFHGTSGFDGSG